MGALPIVWHGSYEVDIGPHVFPTAKYRLVRAALLSEGVAAPEDFETPVPASDDQVALVHTAEYLRKIREDDFDWGERARLEVPFSPALREASWICAGGSVLAGRRALERGVAMHLGGGFHHAFPDHGEGFCLINDVAVAIRVLMRERAIHRAAVIDLDVHHGNGTSAVFSGDSEVFTFSMHQEYNYPAVKPPGDLDIGLDDGATDETYLALLEPALTRVIERHRPDIAFYLAGADPYMQDQLGGLALTIDGLRRRDDMVFGSLRAAGVAVAAVPAGGYAARQADTVAIHCNTVRAAKAANAG